MLTATVPVTCCYALLEYLAECSSSACCLQLPYEQETEGEDALSSITLNAAVSAIRNEVGADLVHLIGMLPDDCGIS